MVSLHLESTWALPLQLIPLLCPHLWGSIHLRVRLSVAVPQATHVPFHLFSSLKNFLSFILDSFLQYLICFYFCSAKFPSLRVIFLSEDCSALFMLVSSVYQFHPCYHLGLVMSHVFLLLGVPHKC